MLSASSQFKPARIEIPQRMLNRRQFLYLATLAAGSLAAGAYAAPRPKLKSPNDKLDVGIIGCGNKGEHDSQGMSSETIVALCDVDETLLAAAAQKWPNARRYRDYRVMKLLEDEEMEASGALFIGDKGKIAASQLGGHPHLLPLSRMASYKQPDPTIPRVPGPYKDFIRACKGGPPACSNFDISGPFTEMVLPGNVALRVGRKIEWDAQDMRAKNCPQAHQYIQAQFRKGWTV
jgi:hypothetical protein